VIVLKTLRWDNCFSYGSGNELDLTSNTLTQVLGTNGVGKSSIPLILEEVLYNKNSKGVKKADIPNRNIGNEYNISLEFDKNGESYTIDVRRKGASSKVVLLQNGEDISSHTATNTYKQIQELIGIEFKTFSQIVYQNTNSSLQFLTATDTNRKKFLIELLNLDAYVELFEVFKTLSKESSDKLLKIQAEIDTLESWLKNNKLNNSDVQTPKIVPNSPIEEENTLRSLQAELKNIHEINSKISANNRHKERLSQINITSLRNREFSDPVEVHTIQGIIGGLKADIKASADLIQKMNRLEDKCHSCEQDISPEFRDSLIRQETSRKEEKEKSLVKHTEELKAKTEHNLKVVKVKETIKEWEDLYRSIDNNLPSEIKNESDLQIEIEALTATIKSIKADIKDTETYNSKVLSNNARIEVIKEQTEEMTDKVIEANIKLETEKAINSNLEILKKSFSTNGLIAYKIENLVKELESLTNEYLAEMSGGRFTLAFVVTNDKLNIQITDNEVEVDILALSSGELARVNTSTLLAIRKLMSSISHSKINVLFLDEVINVLDDVGREKLVEVLLEEDLNTYLVSHGWSHPLLSKIEITKSGNISRLDLG